MDDGRTRCVGGVGDAAVSGVGCGQHFRIAFKNVLLKAHLMCFRFVRSRVEIKKLHKAGKREDGRAGAEVV